MKRIAAGLAFSLAVLSAPVHSGFISWTDWTAATGGDNGTATGVISIGSETVGVTYSGDIYFAQLGPYSTTNFWTEPDDTKKPYTGNSVVDNAPLAGEMIALWREGITNTLTFSQPVTNPIFAIVSLGRPDLPVTYDFDVPFTVLSNGVGWWSFANNYNPATLTTSAVDRLTGNEAHLAIQFLGTVSSISWAAITAEEWHGITVGLTQDALIPEPTTLALFSLGLAGLVAIRRKKLAH